MKKVKAEALTSSDFEQSLRAPKILLFDIETAPNLSHVWGHYEQNVLSHVKEWYVLAWCAKWLDGKPVSRSLPDYKGYKPGSTDDKALCRELWHILDEADVVIAHNGNSFDIKKMNARFLVHGFGPPSFFAKIDTKLVAKRYFRHNSNKLDDLGKLLGVGRKVVHTGFQLWLDCMAGDSRAWNLMVKYNRQDVLLLERVYLKLRPWMESHPNMNVLLNRDAGCTKCGSKNIQHRGWRFTPTGRQKRWQCNDCKGYSTGIHVKTTNIR